MDEKTLKSIERKLDLLIRLNAVAISKGMTVSEGAPLLKELGLSVKDIAIVLRSTENTVNVKASQAKASKKNVKKTKKPVIGEGH